MKKTDNPELIHPIEIQESLRRFQEDYPDPTRAAFIMMKFGDITPYQRILECVRKTLAQHRISGLRADDKQYHDDLFANVLTYLYGCGFGIALFERINADEFNPNVSLEVGYMFALHKPVCLLKDQTLKALHSDLVGKLYKAFDPHDPGGSVPAALEKWLVDKRIITAGTVELSERIMYPLLFGGDDARGWSAQEVDIFFRNLKQHAIDRARREYENVDEAEDVNAISERARELIEKQVAAYDLIDLFDKWERQTPNNSSNRTRNELDS
jgi:hypothetical protein